MCSECEALREDLRVLSERVVKLETDQVVVKVDLANLATFFAMSLHKPKEKQP